MPTEHEFKYVISLDLAKEFSQDQMKKLCSRFRQIEQGVICHGPGMYLRIRKQTERKKTQWQMTFKLKDADRTIEIENSIESRDAEDLWRRCYWCLTKDRYIYEHDDIKWEIDFFKQKDEVYFILAEAELPEYAPRPKKMPSILKKYLIYEVPLTDDRFSNKRLGDVEYAAKMYSQLKKGLEDVSDEE